MRDSQTRAVWAADSDVGRRTVLRVGSAAWAVPVIVTASAAPALAVSNPGPGALSVARGTTSVAPDGEGFYNVECSGLTVTAGSAAPAGTLTLTVTYQPDVTGPTTALIYKYPANPAGWSGPTPGQESSARTLTYTYTGSLAAGATVAFPDGHFFGTARSADSTGGEGVFTLTFSAGNQTPAEVSLATPHHVTTRAAFRIDNQNTTPGSTLTVPIRVDTLGNEAGYTFSIAYDQTKLTNPQVTIGNAGGDVIFNANNPGKIGFSVTSFPGGTIAPATNAILVNVAFTAAPNAATGTTPITFTDTPATRKASGTDPNTPITQPTYTSGTITISPGTTRTSAFRIDNQNTTPGSTLTVPIRVDTLGNEAGYTFSIAYDQTKLTNPQVTIGNAGGDVIFNANNPGKIGFSVTSFPGGTIAPATNAILVNVAFTAAPNAATGTTPITFTDTPATRKASGTDPNTPITQPTYTSGTITIS